MKGWYAVSGVTGSECQNSTLKSPCVPMSVSTLASVEMTGAFGTRAAKLSLGAAVSTTNGGEGVVAAGLEGERIGGDEGEGRGLREAGQQAGDVDLDHVGVGAGGVEDVVERGVAARSPVTRNWKTCRTATAMTLVGCVAKP